MRGASRTAEVVCFARALEALRPDPILVDPHAAGFLRPSWRAALPMVAAVAARTPDMPGMRTYIVGRHRWFDEHLQRAIDAGVRELVVLGAGYDSRALRFPSVRTWEVDHPATSARKARVAPDHPAQRVAADLQTVSLRDALVGAGFPQGATAFVVWEGVTMYLTREAVVGTLTTLAGLLGPGSAVVFDALRMVDGPGPVAHLHRLAPALMPALGEPITFLLHPDDAAGLLAPAGWTLEDLADASALQARYAPDRAVYPACWVARASLGGPPRRLDRTG